MHLRVGISDLMRQSNSLVFHKIWMSLVCTRRLVGAVVFLVLYVDDILLIGNNVLTLQSGKIWLSKNFSMKDLKEATYILGIKIYRIDLKGCLVFHSLHT